MSQSQPPRLLDQVSQSIRLKHYSLKTEKSYIYYIRDFILFHHKRHSKDMGAEEIRAYLSHLAVDRNVAASTQTVALSALLFLYRQVLQLELPYIDEIERAKRPERVPVVFTRAEVKQILTHLDGVDHLIAQYNAQSGKPFNRSELQNMEAVIRFVTASRLTYWKMAMTFAPYRSCWGTRMSRQP
jgi:integrase